ncbi:MAG: hypothetical protein JW908_10680 [Anaerolineales bacterium]|nr:hypothetical protein [Anaerolineales bacterium]
MQNTGEIKDHWRVNALRVVCGITAFLFAWWVYSFAIPAYQAGILFLSRRLLVKFVFGIGVCFFSIFTLGVSFSRWQGLVFEYFDRGETWLRQFKRVNILVFVLMVAGVSYLLMSPSGLIYKDKASRLLSFWLLTCLGSGLLKSAGIRQRWIVLLGGAAVFTAFGFRLAAYIPDVSTYPLTLSWSEASRYYYASLFFAKKIYGEALPLTILHPTRYLLQSIPFIIPHSPLWLHRLWQVVLWIFISLGFATVFTRRLDIRDGFLRLTVVVWSFLFVLIGPVYYHLQVPAILIIACFFPTRHDRRSLIISYLALVFASIWAGISRVNWYPVPGLLASALYFLEVNRQGKSLWRYLLLPALSTVGGFVIAAVSQVVYIRISGNPVGQFTSSFSSNLLWYRLFPNSTYPLGILGAAVFVSLPLILLACMRLWRHWHRVHIIRLVGLAAILFVLFAGGLVVSVKIGGGSNLHNMDAFLTVLLVICGLIYFDKLTFDTPPSESDGSLHPLEVKRLNINLHGILLSYAILAPVLFTIFSGGALTYPDQEVLDTDLSKIRRLIEKAGAEGDVLFIGERQLLIFGEVQGVKLVPEYERVFLMEMAMAGNPEYLEQFHQDLKHQRYHMIISEPLYLPVKGEAERFGEENNAWVNYVGKNLRCYYTAIKTVKELKVQLLIPQTKINKKCE